MKKTLIAFAVSASIAAAQVVVPDGTKIRVRLDRLSHPPLRSKDSRLS